MSYLERESKHRIRHIFLIGEVQEAKKKLVFSERVHLYKLASFSVYHFYILRFLFVLNYIKP